jgi:Immunity protein 26
MGWYEHPRVPGVMIGDEAFDTTHEFMTNLAKVYQETFDRRPTLQEMSELLEIELRVSGGKVLGDLDERRVTKITVGTEPKRKDQAFKVGDVFAIPLGESGYAFGRIMIIDKQRGSLIEIFRAHAQRPHCRPGIVESGRLFHPVRFGDAATLKEWRWLVIASDEDYQLSETDRALQFASPGPVKGWCVIDLANKIVRTISEAEAAPMERGWSWRAPQIEERIRAAASSVVPLE